MKILCINGGGIFGIIPAYFLSKTTADVNKFDAFGGTSIGAHLVLGYQNGSTEYILKYMKASLPKIFKKSWTSTLNPYGPEYSDKELNKSLQRMLPMKFGDIKKPTFIGAYDVVNERPKIFDNILGPSNPDTIWGSWEVARASCAAPTYFIPYKGLIDGGVCCNNISIVTAWGLNDKLDVDFRDMELLVMGTGHRMNTKFSQKQLESFTQLDWLKPIINLVMTGNEQIFNYGCRRMDFKKCIFWDPIELNSDWKMDDASLIPKLEESCKPYLDRFREIYNTF